MSDSESVFKADAFTTDRRLFRFSYLFYKWTYGCSTECNGVSEYNEVLVTGPDWYAIFEKLWWKRREYRKKEGIVALQCISCIIEILNDLDLKRQLSSNRNKNSSFFLFFLFWFFFPLLVSFSPYLYWGIIDK